MMTGVTVNVPKYSTATCALTTHITESASSDRSVNFAGSANRRWNTELTATPISIAATNTAERISGACSSGTAPTEARLIIQPMRMMSRVRSISSSRRASAAVVIIVRGSGVPRESEGALSNGFTGSVTVGSAAGFGLSTTVAPLAVPASSSVDIFAVYRDAPRMRFTDKVYLVTGGGRGIGRAIVQRLAEEGGRVCILDPDRHSGTDAAREYGASVLYVRGNVGSERDVRRCVAACVKWGGRLDGVVNNAGIASPTVGRLEDVSLATWNKYLEVNLTGAFLVTRAAVEHLRRTKGAVVNISSTRALQSEPETEPYATTKGGLLALTHALAISLGFDVRVNCISPGWIATSSFAARDERKPPKLAKKDHAQHPVGRVGRPEDIASLCAWLLSDEAGFVTGENVVSDGGMTRKMIYA